MNAKTLKALKGSVKKWEKIVARTGIDEGDENCPLCKLFADDPNCAGCPVARKTGQPDCMGTPYADWDYWGGRYSTANTRRLSDFARAELAFLKSLLPRKRK